MKSFRCVQCFEWFKADQGVGDYLCSNLCLEKRNRKAQGLSDASQDKPKNKADSGTESTVCAKETKAEKKARLKIQKRIRNREKKINKIFRWQEKAGFYGSRSWYQLRYRAIKVYGRVCAACRTTEGEMHVDHIKPRSKFPELSLEISNLQVLCASCNIGKGAWDHTDWRDIKNLNSKPKEEPTQNDQLSFLSTILLDQSLDSSHHIENTLNEERHLIWSYPTTNRGEEDC